MTYGMLESSEVPTTADMYDVYIEKYIENIAVTRFSSYNIQLYNLILISIKVGT